MPNEDEARLNALISELRAHIADLSMRAATLAGEVAVRDQRLALLTAQVKAQEVQE